MVMSFPSTGEQPVVAANARPLGLAAGDHMVDRAVALDVKVGPADVREPAQLPDPCRAVGGTGRQIPAVGRLTQGHHRTEVSGEDPALHEGSWIVGASDPLIVPTTTGSGKPGS